MVLVYIIYANVKGDILMGSMLPYNPYIYIYVRYMDPMGFACHEKGAPWCIWLVLDWSWRIS